MLWNFETLRGMPIHASDGEIGSVRDLLFDDSSWITRYLVVETGSWLWSRRVLLAPQALDRPDAEQEAIPVRLTRAQVKDSPPVDTDRPVARREEEALHEYYRWMPYWSAPMAGSMTMPVIPPTQPPASVPTRDGDPHLRSARELEGYSVIATDGAVGQVDGLLLDDGAWSIHYLVVDTGAWLPGRKVLVSPRWADRIAWPTRDVRLGIGREAVEASPSYHPNAGVSRSYEEQLYGHYGMPPYW